MSNGVKWCGVKWCWMVWCQMVSSQCHDTGKFSALWCILNTAICWFRLQFYVNLLRMQQKVIYRVDKLGCLWVRTRPSSSFREKCSYSLSWKKLSSSGIFLVTRKDLATYVVHRYIGKSSVYFVCAKVSNTYFSVAILN